MVKAITKPSTHPAPPPMAAPMTVARKSPPAMVRATTKRSKPEAPVPPAKTMDWANPSLITERTDTTDNSPSWTEKVAKNKRA